MGVAADRHGALKRWLQDRLTEGERPREEWRALWEASWDHLLATPVDELLDPKTAKALADELLDPELVTELSRPIVATLSRAVIAELRQDEQPVERFVPSDAQEKLRATLARPGLVHPDWVRAMFRGEAVEAVLNDALYRALKDFSTLLPRLLVKISPMGRFGMLSGAGAFAEKLIDELEKHIEPEIKAFLAESTGSVLERAAEFTISRLDEPASIEFRVNFVRFIMSKSPAFYLEAADETLVDEVGEIVALSARHVVGMPDLREDIHRWIDQAFGYCRDKTLGEVLEIDPTRVRPPIDALADASWPAFRMVVRSPQAQAWMDSLLDELLDEYERTAPR